MKEFSTIVIEKRDYYCSSTLVLWWLLGKTCRTLQIRSALLKAQKLPSLFFLVPSSSLILTFVLLSNSNSLLCTEILSPTEMFTFPGALFRTKGSTLMIVGLWERAFHRHFSPSSPPLPSAKVKCKQNVIIQ